MKRSNSASTSWKNIIADRNVAPQRERDTEHQQQQTHSQRLEESLLHGTESLRDVASQIIEEEGSEDSESEGWSAAVTGAPNVAIPIPTTTGPSSANAGDSQHVASPGYTHKPTAHERDSEETHHHRHKLSSHHSPDIASPLSTTSASPLSRSYSMSASHRLQQSGTSHEHSLSRSQTLTPSHASSANRRERTNIVVGIRSRPLSDMEIDMEEDDIWEYEPPNRIFERPKPDQLRPKEYVYDHVYPPPTETVEVYETMGVPIVDASLEGYNSTIFAYGQTSSGKTHTLMGTAESPGITVLSVHDVFRAIEEAKGDRCFEVRVSYVEIYNEELKDLLNPDAGNLRIVDHPITGPQVKGLTEEIVVSPARVIELLDVGERNRRVAFTHLNANSSRSHTLFRMVLESWHPEEEAKENFHANRSLRRINTAPGGGFDYSGSPSKVSRQSSRDSPRRSLRSVRVSCLNLVDLAGSERVSKTRPTGTLLKESGRINASLLTLGTVISKLGQGSEHIPYRDSKLTRLLSASLGGNAKTAIICTISPAGWNRNETKSTLHFASRAQKVVNRAHINEISDKVGQLEAYKREIANLKAALLEARGGQLMTAAGETITAEELISKMKEIQEEREQQLEKQLQEENEKRRDAETRNRCYSRLIFGACQAFGYLSYSPHILRILISLGMGQISPEGAENELFNLIPGLGKQVSRKLRLMTAQNLNAHWRSPDSFSSASSGESIDSSELDCESQVHAVTDDKEIENECCQYQEKIQKCLDQIERSGFQSRDVAHSQLSPKSFLLQIIEICDFATCQGRVESEKNTEDESTGNIVGEHSIHTAQGQRKGLQKQVDSQEKIIDELRSELQQTKSSLSEAKANRAQFEAEVRRLRGNLTSERESNKLKMQRLEKQLEHDRQSRPGDLSDPAPATRDTDRLNEENTRLVDQIEDLKQQILDKDSEIEDFHEELRATKAASESVEHRAETLEDRLRETREQLDNLRASYAEVEDENYRLIEKNEKLAYRYTDSYTGIEDVEQIRKDYEEEISGMRGKLEKVYREKVEIERSESELQGKITNLREEMKSTQEDNNNLRNWLNETIEALAQAGENSNDKGERFLERALMQKEDAEGKYHIATKHIEQLTVDLNQREGELQDLLNQCEEMIDRQKSLEEEAQAYRQHAEENESAYLDRETDVLHFRDTALNHIKIMGKHFTSTCAEIRSGLKQLKSQKDGVYQRMHDLEDEFQNGLYHSLRMAVSEVLKENNKVKESYKSLESRIRTSMDTAITQIDIEDMLSDPRDLAIYAGEVIEKLIQKCKTVKNQKELQMHTEEFPHKRKSASSDEYDDLRSSKIKLQIVCDKLQTQLGFDNLHIDNIENFNAVLDENVKAVTEYQHGLSVQLSKAIDDKEKMTKVKDNYREELREYKAKLESLCSRLHFALDFGPIDVKDSEDFYNSIQESIDNLKERYNSLSTELLEMKEENEKRLAEKAELEKSCGELKMYRTKLEALCGRLKSSLNFSEIHLDNSEKFYRDVEENVKKMSENYDSVCNDLTEVTAAKKEAEDKADNLNKECHKLQEYKRKLEFLCYKLQSSFNFGEIVSDSLGSFEKNVQESIDKINESHSELSSELWKLREEKENVVAEKETSQQQCHKLRQYKTKLEELCRKLQSSLGFEELDLDSSEAFHHAVSVSINRLNELYDSLSNELTQANEEREKVASQKQQFEDNFEKLKRDYEITCEKLECYYGKLKLLCKHLQSSLGFEEVNIEDSEAFETAIRKNIDKLNDWCQSISSDLSQIKKENESFIAKNEECCRKYEQVLPYKTKLELLCDKLQSSLDFEQVDIENGDMFNEAVQRNIEKLNDWYSSAYTEVSEVRQQKEEYRQECESLRPYRTKLESLCKQLQSSLECEKLNIEKENDLNFIVKSSIDELNDSCNSLSKELSQMKTTNESLARQKEEYEKRCQKLRVYKMNLEELCQKLQSSLGFEELDLESSETFHNAVNASIDRLNGLNNSLSNELNKAKEEKEKVASEKQQLEENFVKLKRDYKTTCMKLKYYYGELKWLCKHLQSSLGFEEVNIEDSEAFETAIRKNIDKLNDWCQSISSDLSHIKKESENLIEEKEEYCRKYEQVLPYKTKLELLCDTLQSSLDFEQVDIENGDMFNEAVQRNIEKLNDWYSSAYTEVSEVRQQKEEYRQECESLRPYRTNLESLCKNLQRSLDSENLDINSNAQLEVDQLNGVFDSLISEVSKLRADKDNAVSEKEEFRNQCGSLHPYKLKLEWLCGKLESLPGLEEVDMENSELFYQNVGSGVTKLKETLDWLSTECSRVKSENEKLIAEQEEYVAVSESLRPYKTQLESLCQKLQSSLGFDELDIDITKSVYRLVQDTMSQVNSCHNSLSSKLAEAERNREEAVKEKDIVKTKLKALCEKLRSCFDFFDLDIESSAEVFFETVENSVNHLKDEYEYFSDQLEKEEAERQKQQQVSEQMRSYKEQLESLCNNLRSSLNLTNIDTENSETFFHSVQLIIHRMKEKLKYTEESTGEYSRRCEQLESQVSELRNEKAQVEHDLDECSKEYKQLQCRFEEAERKHSSDLESTTSELDKKSTRIRTLESELRNLKMELNEYKANSRILENEIGKLRSVVQSVRKSNIKLSKQLSVARKQLYERKITNIRDKFDTIGTWVDVASSSPAAATEPFSATMRHVGRGSHFRHEAEQGKSISPPWSADIAMQKRRRGHFESQLPHEGFLPSSRYDDESWGPLEPGDLE